MRLKSARVQNYRSVIDTGWFDIEQDKTILVGSNEAGKTAVLQALQRIRKPDDVPGFDPLRDYPRSRYNDISTKKVDPNKVIVAAAKFALDDEDLAEIGSDYAGAIYVREVRLTNKHSHSIEGGPALPTWDTDTAKNFQRMAAHMDTQAQEGAVVPSQSLATISAGLATGFQIPASTGAALEEWLNTNVALVDESNTTEDARHTALIELTQKPQQARDALATLSARLPTFVLFNNYFRVRPSIHLGHLAERLETGVLDDDQYDYGNQCLLKLLGFTAAQLSALGSAPEPGAADATALQAYKDQLDNRSYQLNAASVKLTKEIRRIWNPQKDKAEASTLRFEVDGQYLKVVVEDDLGVAIELDQRSEGFQWMVSFFVVFFAEAQDKHDNAILLLDEPGMSLHALKQKEFRHTLSELATTNQTIYTTHSPFLVGPDELDLVRVVEMTDREVGTKVHTTVTAESAASLLPLQEALGYDLAQTLFTQQRNLVLEGLTDYWYLEGAAELLADAGILKLNPNIALVPANSASKVAYYATILHANGLKVAALLDSDAAGDQAATQDTLVHQLGQKGILRTKDVYSGEVKKVEVEDLLRDTLVEVAKTDLGWDISKSASEQPGRPIVDIFTKEVSGFSKYRLAKAFLRWTRQHDAQDLAEAERLGWTALIEAINKALK